MLEQVKKEKNMKYYTVQDIMEITGSKQNKAYEIIRQLWKKYKRKYPEAIFIQGKIPKWYFDSVMGFEKEKEI